ncbi:MAG TPA: FAD-dependent oxidoreductase [Candidatus Limnocylindria bacterium]|nr:FAD-dependent oxidoreductase [Candidatus Limnocylindria bacterium]
MARKVDVLVVGGGPAGLAAAAALAAAGAGRVEVVDRESEAGGIPRHSHHTGYGLRDLHRVMTGPAYARRRVDLATSAGAEVRAGVSVTGWAGERLLDLTSHGGLERVQAGAVVLATGARERPRAARWVAGDRPSGVLTTGQLQQAVYLFDQPVGRRAVVVGAEHVSFSALVTLVHAGVEVVAMITDLPRAQSYRAFHLGAGARWRVPVITRTRVSRVLGHGRVSAVELQRVDRPDDLRRLSCDTVVFTGDWVPDQELARAGDLAMDPGTRGPRTDTEGRTDVDGVFAVGNLVHPVETADIVALEGGRLADPVLRYLRGHRVTEQPIAVRTEPPLRWVAPNLVRPGDRAPARDRFLVWPSAFVEHPRFQVRQGDRQIGDYTTRRVLVPHRPRGLPADWQRAVRADEGPVTVTVSGSLVG